MSYPTKRTLAYAEALFQLRYAVRRVIGACPEPKCARCSELIAGLKAARLALASTDACPEELTDPGCEDCAKEAQR